MCLILVILGVNVYLTTRALRPGTTAGRGRKKGPVPDHPVSPDTRAGAERTFKSIQPLARCDPVDPRQLSGPHGLNENAPLS